MSCLNAYNICHDCNVSYVIDEGSMVCPKCGEEKDIINNADRYNMDISSTIDSAFVAFKIIGYNSQRYNKIFMQCCADYQTYHNNNNHKYMSALIGQYQGNKVPKTVQCDAINMFNKIKSSGYKCRGNTKKGIMGACLFYACMNKNIAKTSRDISHLMSIDIKTLSAGDQTLRELSRRHIIELPIKLDPYIDYIDQYFHILDIPRRDNTLSNESNKHNNQEPAIRYKNFILALIKITDQFNIGRSDARASTKCVACIYMLTLRVKNLRSIHINTIIKECKIAKSTFIKYFMDMNDKYIYIKPAFKKYKIPMPVEWKYPIIDWDNVTYEFKEY